MPLFRSLRAGGDVAGIMDGMTGPENNAARNAAEGSAAGASNLHAKGALPTGAELDEMIAVLAKTFMVGHVDDSDEHLAQALVFNAARLAWRMREQGVDVQTKTSVSDVVTSADLAAEKFVVEVLTNLRPEDGIVGEEGAARPSTSGRTWVIDPVDGTFNFAAGSDYFCSALALVAGDSESPEEVIFGAVHRAAMGYTWFGGKNYPTTRDGIPVTVGAKDSLAQASAATYLHPSRYGTEIAKEWERVTARTATVRMLGSSSIDLASVADGNWDLWLHNSVKSWDWLPGRALIEGAGGVAEQVITPHTTWSIAGNAALVEQAIAALRAGS